MASTWVNPVIVNYLCPHKYSYSQNANMHMQTYKCTYTYKGAYKHSERMITIESEQVFHFVPNLRPCLASLCRGEKKSSEISFRGVEKRVNRLLEKHCLPVIISINSE